MLKKSHILNQYQNKYISDNKHKSTYISSIYTSVLSIVVIYKVLLRYVTQV